MFEKVRLDRHIVIYRHHLKLQSWFFFLSSQHSTHKLSVVSSWGAALGKHTMESLWCLLLWRSFTGLGLPSHSFLPQHHPHFLPSFLPTSAQSPHHSTIFLYLEVAFMFISNNYCWLLFQQLWLCSIKIVHALILTPDGFLVEIKLSN